MQRRTFLKQLALVASVPLIGRASPANSLPEVKRATSHRLLSCNIRVALPEDEAAGNGWSGRREICIDVIRAQKPDIFCLQEVLRVQMEDLRQAFPGFGSFGFEGPEMDARTIGYQGIAKNPIFYSRDRYELVTAGGFWLSETPHIPGSLSWDSARARHVNWVRLHDRTSRRQLRVLSTHLDHVNQHAREEQMKLILTEAAVYQDSFPQALAGDFNSRRNNPVLKLTMDAGWRDTHAEAPEPKDDGNSTHGFTVAEDSKAELTAKRGPIDFVLTRGPITTHSWKLIRDSRNGRYPSDHFFVAVELELI